MTLSIIIITLNEESYISGILNDLTKQTMQDFEIIISDSNSTDNTKYIVKSFYDKFEKIRFINTGQTKGPAFGRNFGANNAVYDNLLFIDADTRIRDKDFIKKYLSFKVNTGSDTGSFYPEIDTNNLFIKLGNKLMQLGLFITQYISPTAVGACMYSTKEVHSSIGGFKEYVHLCEDSDYVRDAKRKGFKVRNLPITFLFDNRRFVRDGLIKTNMKYIYANMIRFITGKSISYKQIKYNFDPYD